MCKVAHQIDYNSKFMGLYYTIGFDTMLSTFDFHIIFQYGQTNHMMMHNIFLKISIIILVLSTFTSNGNKLRDCFINLKFRCNIICSLVHMYKVAHQVDNKMFFYKAILTSMYNIQFCSN